MWFHSSMVRASSVTPSSITSSAVTSGSDTPSADLIRTAGVKVTPGRVRVLDLLRAAHQPLCHGEMESALESLDAAIDRVTLYRVLDSLVACGLALKAVDTRGVFRFSAAGTPHRHADHIHFRCVDCGGVFCLAVEPPPPPMLPDGFRLRDVELDVRGTCADCTSQVGDGG
jgi:Fur family ferric uptake transcriptional regulator